jgi:hypothetical protein
MGRVEWLGRTKPLDASGRQLEGNQHLIYPLNGERIEPVCLRADGEQARSRSRADGGWGGSTAEQAVHAFLVRAIRSAPFQGLRSHPNPRITSIGHTRRVPAGRHIWGTQQVRMSALVSNAR